MGLVIRKPRSVILEFVCLFGGVIRSKEVSRLVHIGRSLRRADLAQILFPLTFYTIMAEKRGNQCKPDSSTMSHDEWTAPKAVHDILKSSDLRDREIREVEAHLYRKDLEIEELKRDKELALSKKDAELREGLNQLRAEIKSMEEMAGIHKGLHGLAKEAIEKRNQENAVVTGERDALRAEKDHYANENRKLQTHVAQQDKTIQGFVDKMALIAMAPADEASAIANGHMAQQTHDLILRLQRDIAERDDQIIQYERGKETMRNQVKDYWKYAHEASVRNIQAEIRAQEQQAIAAQAQTMVVELQKAASEARTSAFDQQRQIEGFKDDLYRKQETIDELVKKYPTTVAHVRSMKKTREPRRINDLK